MGKLFEFATRRETLTRAWKVIHSNGRASKAPETKVAIEQFDRDFSRNINRIQNRLRAGEFQFDPQKGVLKTKSSGGKRGIVMASVHNRVVERAWLDTLQSKSSFVKEVVSVSTSIGGVPNRSVPHGLKFINEAFESGYKYFVRSDISGFFDHIPRNKVIDAISKDIKDEKFIEVLTQATTVLLGNEQNLGEDRSVFPTNEEGVAQGSPLSPLFGNILLYDFDNDLNRMGSICCIRFIDDFLILSKTREGAEKAFIRGRNALKKLGMSCHDPFAKKADPEKAGQGAVDSGFVFLGYDIRPGLRQPSRKARQSIRSSIVDHLRYGRRGISDVIEAESSFASKQRYVQTLATIDLVLRGWGQAFAYGNSPTTLNDLDQLIDKNLDDFRKWYSGKIKKADWKTRRRTGGVCLLGDIAPKTFDEVPFKLESGGRFVTSKNTITISTDGSVLTSGRRRGKDRGPGGWAFLVHETGEEKAGSEYDVTNNQMELRAVIEAIRHVPQSHSLRIRTDSQYVHDAVQKQHTIKSNQDMWKEFQKLAANRRIRVEWVKGHSGDVQNERADKLANDAAKALKAGREYRNA